MMENLRLNTGIKQTVDPERRPISAGWYATEDGRTTSVAHWLEEDDFRNNGGVMNHEMVRASLRERNPLQWTTQVLDGCSSRKVYLNTQR